MTHPQTEPGEIVFRIKDGRVEITRADPVVVRPGDWLDRVVNWGPPRWRTVPGMTRARRTSRS